MAQPLYNVKAAKDGIYVNVGAAWPDKAGRGYVNIMWAREENKYNVPLFAELAPDFFYNLDIAKGTITAVNMKDQTLRKVVAKLVPSKFGFTLEPVAGTRLHTMATGYKLFLSKIKTAEERAKEEAPPEDVKDIQF